MDHLEQLDQLDQKAADLSGEPQRAAYVAPSMQTYSEAELRKIFPEVFAASIFSDTWNSIIR
jgi:predicted RNA-binding protein YlxR (DUF448 family)